MFKNIFENIIKKPIEQEEKPDIKDSFRTTGKYSKYEKHMAKVDRQAELNKENLKKGGLKYDIPEDRGNKVYKLTNSEKNADRTIWKSKKVNQEALETKRQEYIDDAILKVVADNEGIISHYQAVFKNDRRKEEEIKKQLWRGLEGAIMSELESGAEEVNELSVNNINNEEAIEQHWREFPTHIVMDRFFEYDFLNKSEDDIPNLADVEKANKEQK